MSDVLHYTRHTRKLTSFSLCTKSHARYIWFKRPWQVKQQGAAMINRRTFVSAVGAGAIATSLVEGQQPARCRRLAVITTEWRERSHAWHMAERFLHGYPINGRWHRPAFEVVSAYVDQFPRNDLSRARAKEFGFTIYKTIAEALRSGGDRLNVDAVL